MPSLIQKIIDKHFNNYEIIKLLGASEIRIRYARTFFGQWWITLSQAIFIVSIGITWTFLWGAEISRYLPTFALGIVLWGFLSGVIGEAPYLYNRYRAYILDSPIDKVIFVYSLILNHTIIFLHNIVFVTVVLIFYLNPQIDLEFIFYGIFVLIVFLMWFFQITKILAILGAKYRDVQNLVSSLINISFFLSPVLWSISQFSEKYQKLVVILNPFAGVLYTFKHFLIGGDVSILKVTIIFYITLFFVLKILNKLIFEKQEERVVFWIM